MFDIYGVWEMTPGGSLLAMQRVQEKNPPIGCWYFDLRTFKLNRADVKSGKKYRVVVSDGRYGLGAINPREFVIECRDGSITEPTLALAAALARQHSAASSVPALTVAELRQPAYPEE